MRIFRLVPLFLAAVASLVAVRAHALTAEDIAYPIPELNMCADQAECRAYCDHREDPDVVAACVSFAKKYSLLPSDDLSRAERFVEAMKKGGPGGCKTEQACRLYCEDASHLPACLTFIDKYKLVPEAELTEVRKIASAVKRGAKLPGDCSTKATCENYCADPTHGTECLAFAEASGILSTEELAQAKKFIPLIQRGETPGQCTSKDGCEAYCRLKEHHEECLTFALKEGLLTSEEVRLIRLSGGRGPGDCFSRETCETYCNNPANQPDCMRFAVEHGMMTAEEATQAGAVADFEACVAIAPAPVVACLRENLGDELFTSLEKGVMPMSLSTLEDTLIRVRRSRACLDKMTQQPLGKLSGAETASVAACLKSETGGDVMERIKGGKISCREIGSLQAKITECVQRAIKESIETCFSLPCAESIACFQKSQKASASSESAESTESSRIRDRMETCTKELMYACLDKSCTEMFACLKGFESGAEGSQEVTDPEIAAKVNACVQEMQQQQSVPSGQ